MLFNSLQFLVFFPCVFLLYWALPHRGRQYFLLASSWYFYMCWKPELIVLILVSTAVDYFCGLGMARRRGSPGRRKALLALSLAANLGLLFFFKYFNFFGQALTDLCRAASIPFSAPALEIILPVGISFYTFQTLSYTIDVYRGELEPERDFVVFALFVSYFPQLVAGPIERAGSLLPQLKEPRAFSYDGAAYGAKLMAWGFFKKCVAAEYLAQLADPVYSNVGGYAGGALAVATAAFALQVYCDFGGYSDIARGCARMMGVELMVNFKAPYFAHSVSDFWRRWHISLTRWFRDYVYIPLGGSRKGGAKKCLFLLITFTVSGLWHGAAWTFVAWGMLNGVFLCLESLSGLSRRVPRSAAGRVFSALATDALFCFSLIFFRADSMAGALYVVRHLFDGLGNPLQYAKNAFWAVPHGAALLAGVGVSLTALFAFDLVDERRDAIAALSAKPVLVRWPAYLCFSLALLLLIPKTTPSPFLYFQF